MNIQGIAHIGIRIAQFQRAMDFYQALGFQVIREDYRDRVVVLRHTSGAEINLLDSVNHYNGGRNVLMDEALRYAGYTHLALQVDDIDQSVERVRGLGIDITEGPVTFGDGSRSIFIRDPDRNVIEFSQPDPAMRQRGLSLTRTSQTQPSGEVQL